MYRGALWRSAALGRSHVVMGSRVSVLVLSYLCSLVFFIVPCSALLAVLCTPSPVDSICYLTINRRRFRGTVPWHHVEAPCGGFIPCLYTMLASSSLAQFGAPAPVPPVCRCAHLSTHLPPATESTSALLLEGVKGANYGKHATIDRQRGIRMSEQLTLLHVDSCCEQLCS